ncbi:unnamed protein product [Pipistrellus nathusii]|uniref:Uncharacterized protein n=1 Tax=Pipistrellus nathusii TaxID=59473 RepID=A0ABN9ZV18_PIPNA
MDFRDGAGRGGVREGNLGVCIFFKSQPWRALGPPSIFPASLFQPSFSILFTVQRAEAGWTDSPHLTTLISHRELGAGVLGSNRSSITDSLCGIWQSPGPLWPSVSPPQIIKITP